jgi:hypothetical protein
MAGKFNKLSSEIAWDIGIANAHAIAIMSNRLVISSMTKG